MDKKTPARFFNLTILFYVVFSMAQTTKNMGLLYGLSPVFYEALHYILILFILIYNLKEDRPIMTGLILFLVYSFRIFDTDLVDNEFVLIHGLTLVLAAIWLEKKSEKKTCINVKNPVFLPVAVFLIAGIISSMTGLNPYSSLQQLLVVINFIFMGFLISDCIRSKEDIRHIIFTMFSICVTLIWLIIYELLVKYQYCLLWLSSMLKYRAILGSIHPNSIAGFFAPMILLFFSIAPFLKSYVFKRWLRISAVTMLVILIFTQSRMGVASFIIGIALLCIIKIAFRRRIRFNVKAVTLIAVCLLVLTVFLIPYRKIISARLLRPSSSWVTLYSCNIALESIRHNPVFGVGINNYYALARYAKGPERSYNITYTTKKEKLHIVRELLRCSPHSLFLGLAWGMGFLGAGAFIWILISFFVYAVNLLKKIKEGYEWALVSGLLAGITSVAIHGILSMTFHLTILPAFFWVFIGVVIAVGHMRTGGLTQKISRPGRLCGIPIVLFAILFVANPIIAEKYYRDGLEDIRNQRAHRAINKFKSAGKLVPINSKYHSALGLSYTYKGDMEPAIRAYQRASAVKRSFAPYSIKLGWLYWYQGDYQRALAEFKKAVELDRLGALGGEHYTDLGLAYARIGTYDEALTQFKHADKLTWHKREARFWKWCTLKNESDDLIFDNSCLDEWSTIRMKKALYEEGYLDFSR
ncbi:MAG: tetratricopeptide repeat protein [Candidatus Omnitrophica bacterium]|nr:tetratricopeptide repeat protein [Candidatus Omnitrophota bacterium]